MKRGLLFLSVLFLFSVIQVFAQSLEAVDWGKEASNEQETSYLKFIGGDEYAYYLKHPHLIFLLIYQELH